MDDARSSSEKSDAARIAASLETIAECCLEFVQIARERNEPSTPRPVEPDPDNGDKETAAIAALLTIGPHPSKIAEAIGVNRGSLYRWPEWRKYYEQIVSQGEASRERYRAENGEEWEV